MSLEYNSTDKSTIIKTSCVDESSNTEEANAQTEPLTFSTTIKTIKQEENQMAEVDTVMLASQHSDIRREAAEHTNEIVKEGLKGDYATQTAIKDGRFEVVSTVENVADRLSKEVTENRLSSNDRFFTVGRDLADIRAQIVQTLGDIRNVSELNALKTQIAVQQDGDKTRSLINDLKYNDLNRYLIERNAELVEWRGDARHWRGAFDQAQYAALNNQVQAFGSQLSEARQRMVNFGTMADVGQTATNNNVG